MNQPQISTTAPRAPLRRTGKPASIGVNDLINAVRISIASAESCEQRVWQPAHLSALQASQLRTERLSDLLSCFVASFSGALQLYAPAAADELYAFLMQIHAAGAPGADTTTIERNTTSCAQ